MKERTQGQIKRVIVIVIVLLLAGFGIMMYCEWRGNFPDTLYVCRKMLLAMPIFAILIGRAHARAGQGMSNREYVVQMFGGRNTSGSRKDYMDYARILAAVMVILTHACSMQADADAALWKTNLLLSCTGIGLVCNPLYVMISGSLLLAAEKEEALGTFYFKRFVKVVIPMVVYYVIFLCVSGQISLIPPQNLGEGALQILAGASGIVPHYWLIYILISLYVTVPFIRVMVKNMKDSFITVLFFLILAEELLVTYLPLVGVQIGFTMSLASWEGVFILGYIVTERRTKWMERTVLILGAISAVIVAVVPVLDDSLTGYVYNTAPVMVLFAGAILILLSKLDGILKGKFQFVAQVLSKYSYSIILVHWYGLFVVTWGKIGIQPLRFGCIGGITLTVVVAVVVCFVLGFVAENTAVLAVQRIVADLGNVTKRLCGRK
ncbi:MAG: acyltransferase [Lachnospiraceae bacterium]|nr:acyltransferase [Lachnospiraceae bacterium]